MGTPEPTWPGNQSEGCISHAKVVMLAGGVRVDVLPAGRVVHPIPNPDKLLLVIILLVTI